MMFVKYILSILGIASFIHCGTSDAIETHAQKHINESILKKEGSDTEFQPRTQWTKMTGKGQNVSHKMLINKDEATPFLQRSTEVSTTITVDDKCVLELSKKCIRLFGHDVLHSEANFVYLKLQTTSGVTIKGSELVVGEDLWVWTFFGKEGGIQFLRWPMEFGVWSLGLLTSFTLTKPQTMILNKKSGNCSNLEVGKQTDDKIISKALLNLTLQMMKISKDKYERSYFCYKRRKIIKSNILYSVCKHIVCPLEALAYNCCAYYFETRVQKREITCNSPHHVFEYETVGWTLSMTISTILFVYFPLILFYLAHIWFDQKECFPFSLSDSCLEEAHQINISPDKVVFLNEHRHVTLLKTLFSPIRECHRSVMSRASGSCHYVVRRLERFLLPFLSLLVIGLQIFLDFMFLHSYVLTCVSKGVPMGFRSIIVGYENSKDNFLPYLGGPYIAIGAYLFVTCILLTFPDNMSSLLISGLPGNDVNERISPLRISSSSIERFGSIRFRKQQGYKRLFNVFLAQFYMFINRRYWSHVFLVQRERWQYLNCSKLCYIFFPFYIIFCTLEIMLCVVIYWIPIVSFGLTMIKAYCGRLHSSQRKRRCLANPIYVFTLILIVSVVFFQYMFCTIFMDATLFFTRVVLFTFTGVVVYPKGSYGYLIFTLTVIYYIWQCVLDFSQVYQTLLKDTINICSSIERANERDRLIIKKGDLRGIRESLFEHVIEIHFPKRKQVFISLLKVGVVLTILGLLVNILVETDGFRHLHTIMHVGTALFICAIPQIIKKMCHGHGGWKFRQRRMHRELTNTIINYIGYNIESAEMINSE